MHFGAGLSILNKEKITPIPVKGQSALKLPSTMTEVRRRTSRNDITRQQFIIPCRFNIFYGY